MSDLHRLIYVTASSNEEAVKIGECVVEEKLAACANIFGSTTSIFHWEGKLDKSQEIAMILKTSTDNVPALMERIKGLHSYDCPCIVSVAIEDGNPDFLKWVSKNTN
jgi:periplasmic divalent cation tolerance protein